MKDSPWFYTVVYAGLLTLTFGVGLKTASPQDPFQRPPSWESALRAGPPRFAIKILARDGDRFLAQPYVAPEVGLHLVHGDPKVGTAFSCTQHVGVSAFAEHTDTSVIIDCENGREADAVSFEVKALYFTR